MSFDLFAYHELRRNTATQGNVIYGNAGNQENAIYGKAVNQENAIYGNAVNQENVIYRNIYRNLLGGLYRENPVKSRNYEAVKSSKKWENVGNSYIIPALLLYRYSYI